MKKIFLLFSLSIFLFSCQQKTDPETIKQFSKTLHVNTSFEIKATQQAFINKLTESLRQIKDDNNAQIDTKQLNELLDKAKEANERSFIEISKTKEVDNEINLRKKALAEIELFRSLYENEFPSIIKILESKLDNKLEKASKLFTEKGDEIKSVQKATKEADYDFTNKYNISFPEDSTK